MKKINILFLILLTSCTNGPTVIKVDSKMLKFKAGDKVKVVGFFSNCEGTIVDYIEYNYSDKPFRYRVHFFCPNSTSTIENQIFSEDELK